jgi:hypothetical protein
MYNKMIQVWTMLSNSSTGGYGCKLNGPWHCYTSALQNSTWLGMRLLTRCRSAQSALLLYLVAPSYVGTFGGSFDSRCTHKVGALDHCQGRLCTCLPCCWIDTYQQRLPLLPLLSTDRASCTRTCKHTLPNYSSCKWGIIRPRESMFIDLRAHCDSNTL